MPKMYVKSLKEYQDPFEFDQAAFLKAMKKVGNRKPTSIALEPKTIDSLKKTADKENVPYQVLMRMIIEEGLKRMKKARQKKVA